MSLDKLKSSILFTIHCLLFTVFIFFLTGCAEMVSGAKPSAGSSIRVQVKLGASPILSNYKYVFVYSRKQINIPTNFYTFLPSQSFDFPLSNPAISPTTNETINASKDIFINYYYENYFSSWSDYIYFTNISSVENQEICDPATIYFPTTANQSVNQSFVLSNLNYGSAFSFQNVTGDYNLEFQLELQRLGTESKPSTDTNFYFNFFTINSQGVVVDSYKNDNNYIKNRSGESVERINGSSGTYNDLYSIKVTVI